MTLLGQNVNAYGVEFGDRQAFGKLLRACGEIDGLERVRFTSPHPAEFTDDVIAAMAETPNVMPQLHMPLQSGSDRVLRAMRRSYRQEQYLGIIDRVRAAMPDAAITTDIIVGFPGETEEDFLETMDVVRERARFAGAFTFQYSKRPGTPAATLEEQVPARGRQERYERLVELVNDDRLGGEQARWSAARVELMVAEGEGRKDAATAPALRPRPRQPARALQPPARRRPVDVRPGDMVEVEVTYAAPHHLVADGPVPSVRRTRSGDAWEARNAAAPPAGRRSGWACRPSAYPLRCPRRHPPVADPWLTEQLDLDAYLQRVGGVAVREPSIEALGELQEAHVRAFTFDNIDVLLEDHAGVGLRRCRRSSWAGAGAATASSTRRCSRPRRSGWGTTPYASSAASATRSRRRARTPSRS